MLQFNSCAFGNLTVEADSTKQIIHQVSLPGTVDNFTTPKELYDGIYFTVILKKSWTKRQM